MHYRIGGRPLGGWGRRNLGSRGQGRVGGGVVANDPLVQFSPSTLLDSAGVGDDVGTATISGTYTGTPSYALDDDAGGKYSINSSTGLVEVAASLTAGTDSITISASGTTPAVDPRSFNITVTAAGGATASVYWFLPTWRAA
jgi:hypothetical protein